MNVSLKKIDEASAILKVEIEKNDYIESWEKSLRGLRQKVTMPGFRKGMVPLGLIKKMYGKEALIEEINKLLTNSPSDYLKDNQIKLLGGLIPNETEQKEIDYDKDETFEYCFDVALEPNFNIQFSSNDSLTYYNIITSDKMIDEQIKLYQKRFGSQENVEQVEIEDIVKGKVVELEEGAPKAEGIVVENTELMPSFVKGKIEQKKFLNTKVGDVIVFNPYKAFKGTAVELASFLGIDKKEVKNMKSDFSFEIKEIARMKPAEINQELFDKAFGPDVVQNETDFRVKVSDSISISCSAHSDGLFRDELRELIINKTGGKYFAEEILKRWMVLTNKDKTIEANEEDFPKMITDLRYHLAKEQLAETYDIQIGNDDIAMMANHVIRIQFAQYGIKPPSDEELQPYINDMLKNQDTVQNLVSQVLDEKLFLSIKEKITIENQEITIEDFNKIVEEKRKF